MTTILTAALAATLVLPGGLMKTSNEHGESELVREVRAAETAFAKTLVDRDLSAFARWIATDAKFMTGAQTVTGRDAIAAAWKKFFEGVKPPFSWTADRVEVLASGKLAFSSGPVLDSEGKVISTFNSVWRREADGRWLVVFDKGCDCVPAP